MVDGEQNPVEIGSVNYYCRDKINIMALEEVEGSGQRDLKLFCFLYQIFRLQGREI